MTVPYDEKLGVHPQAEGFTEHQEWDFAAMTPADMLAKADRNDGSLNGAAQEKAKEPAGPGRAESGRAGVKGPDLSQVTARHQGCLILESASRRLVQKPAQACRADEDNHQPEPLPSP